MDYEGLRKPFPPNEWEWRVDAADITNGKPWCRVVPYIQNRAIQNRLDEVCGAENWRNEYREWKLKGQLCGISIFNSETKEWVTKWDGADDTDFQSTKGGLSASMKRAAVQWGIGRHLYELDAVYAECSLDFHSGWEKTKTKDKTVIYWNPKDKKLGGGAVLPTDNEPNEEELKKEVAQKIAAAKDTKIPTAIEFQATADIIARRKEINRLGAELDIGGRELLDTFKAKYNVDFEQADAETLDKCIAAMKAKKK